MWYYKEERAAATYTSITLFTCTALIWKLSLFLLLYNITCFYRSFQLFEHYVKWFDCSMPYAILEQESEGQHARISGCFDNAFSFASMFWWYLHLTLQALPGIVICLHQILQLQNLLIVDNWNHRYAA